MEKPNPATPAQAANPGNGEKVVTQPSSQTPAATTQKGTEGNAAEGKVTISTKEYADLQRAKARTLSFEKRKEIISSRNNAAAPGANGEPANEALAQERARADEADRRALKAEVKSSVRDILAKPEYAALPASTRDLILQNPAMLSEATTLEEALLDIEDFVNDQVSKIESDGGIAVTVKTSDGGSSQAKIPGHDTPAASASGAAPVSSTDLEDVSKLSGPARSRAIIRNSIKQKAMGVQK